MDRNAALTKLEGLVEKGRAQTQNTLEEIYNEWSNRRDVIVRPDVIGLNVDEYGIRPVIEDKEYTLTDYSRGQLLDRAGVPRKFADSLQGMGEYGLLKENMATLMPKVSREGVMFRNVGTLTKGVLSSSYRTMDASPIFESFFKEAMRFDLVPYRGMNTDSRYALSMIGQTVQEPIPNEFVVFGMQIRTSDYGAGALCFELMVLRIICTNLAVGADVFRRVHLGRRFDMSGKGPVIDLSERTHKLDTQALASAVRDAVSSGRAQLGEMQRQIVAADGEAVDINAEVQKLKKKGIRKNVLDKIQATFDSDLPVEVLPQGNNLWRLSNVISLVSQGEEGDSKLDLEKIAMNVMG